VGPNDPAVRKTTANRRGVDGSACANRAVEFAARLHVVSAYHEAPAAAGLVVPRASSMNRPRRSFRTQSVWPTTSRKLQYVESSSAT
jgi:hypothetical protein